MDSKDLEFNQKLSQEFSQKDMNVLVWTNSKTHKNLYMKVGKRNKDSQIELIPLDENELRDLRLEESISETVNSTLFDIDIQEAIDETVVQPLRKVANFDVTNAESMRAARQLADEQLRKIESKTSHDVDVKILEQENQELKEKLDLIAANEFERKKKSLGCSDESIRDPDSLMAWQKGRDATKQKPIPSGVVSLESQQPYQGDFMTKSYANSADLVRDLRDKAQAGDERAKQALNALFMKGLKSGQPIIGKSEGILLKDLKTKRN